MDRRERLIEVFHDTQRFIAENGTLTRAVENSRKQGRFYSADVCPEAPPVRKEGVVTVTKSRTFEAAMRLRRERPDAKIAVLNFASAVNPGGGVKAGSGAQEESLCRCSTLYPTLDRPELWECYYLPNRAENDPLNTDACIWSPGVVICKTDERIPQRLPEEEFVTVDVVTCAAPDLRTIPVWPSDCGGMKFGGVTKEELRVLHRRRAAHILRAAADNGADCLILGAFGCGAFQNDPQLAADAWADALREDRFLFERIEFAVFCTDREMENYIAFRAHLSPDRLS